MDIVPEITRQSIADLIKNDKREDGRDLTEYRDITIETNVVSKAEGSARVRLGGTQVIVGIKPQLGTPFPDTPDLGVLMTNCEMLPIADPRFEPGPPSEDSIELAKNHFPFGTGFGTFASNVSATTYSKFYVELGYENIFGLSRKNYQKKVEIIK